MEQPPGKLFSGPPEISPLDIPKIVGNGKVGELSASDGSHASTDATLFSSSLPVLFHEKFSLNGKDQGFQSVDDLSSDLSKLQQGIEGISSLVNDETEEIGGLLPGNEEELLAGIMDDLDLSGLPSSLEDVVEDYDVFGFGGMELEGDSQALSAGVSKIGLADSVVGNGMPPFVFPNGMGTIAGEHPYGEHPSRTLFVRNINSNVEDSELKALFEQYGDIRSMYTACKHRGFVMISYYDIRAARTAMRFLQHKPLRRRKLDIHFSIPKDNPSDKDINQGTLVIFNLDPSVSNEELRKIFGAYGEVKEIRETPHKRHHKFIEFYDVRAAEAALKGLNRSEIAGKRIKLEPSRPGGARRNLMLQLNQDFEKDESRALRHQVGSPIMNSPPGNWMQFNSQIERSPMQRVPDSSGFGTLGPTTSNYQAGLASILQPHVPNTMKVPPIGRDKGRGSNVEQLFSNTYLAHGIAFQKPHSLPEPRLNHSSRTSPSVSNGSGVETLSGTEFLWGSPKVYADHRQTSAWPITSAGNPFPSVGNGYGLPQSNQHGSFLGLPPHHPQHHVGSAPANIPLERRYGFFSDSSGRSSVNQVAFGGSGLGHNDGSFMVNRGAGVARDASMTLPENVSVNVSSSFGMMSSSKLNSGVLSNDFHSGFSSSVTEGLTERGWSRRGENSGNRIDNRKQFQLDLDKIKSGEDTRTTLMIKNIPNKYTSKMLLAAIDEHHKGTYDFFYLPIDFKNKCNVGYAFINMLSPSHIIPFYEAFNAKKWEKFNSEKVASVAYGRIQGKAALVAHFQNSSLMNEDKRCRPILFNSESSEAGGQIIQENLPSGVINVQVRQLNGFCLGESLESPMKGVSVEKPELS